MKSDLKAHVIGGIIFFLIAAALFGFVAIVNCLR